MPRKPHRKPHYACTYHRDGTVSLWDCLRQVWRRIPAEQITPELLATLSDRERRRIAALRS